MDVALLVEGTYPFKAGGVSVWCDQLLRGLPGHRFTVHAITAGEDNEMLWELPANVVGLHSVPLWGAVSHHRHPMQGSSELRAAFGQLVRSIVRDDAREDFLDALHQLYLLSRQAPLAGALRTKRSLELVLEAMQEAGPGDRGSSAAVGPVSVHDASQVLEHLDHLLRPLYVPAIEADLCHASANGLSILNALGAHWAHQTPLVLSEHGTYLRERYFSYAPDQFSFAVRSLMLRFYKHLAWAGYRIADSIAPVCEYNRRWQMANGAAPERIRSIYNGVDTGHFVATDTEPEVPTLVWVGRIGPLKDVETLLQAFAVVRAGLPTARLRMFGGVHEENRGYFARCIELRDRLGLEESATFEGQTDSVVEAYHAGHVVVLTSVSEGFPYTLIEAMASGIPTVATDVGGVAEATGDAGIIVPPQNPERLAAACLRLLKDEKLRRSMSRVARARVLDKFTLEQNLSAYGALYREVATRHALTPAFPAALDSGRATEPADDRMLTTAASS